MVGRCFISLYFQRLTLCPTHCWCSNDWMTTVPTREAGPKPGTGGRNKQIVTWHDLRLAVSLPLCPQSTSRVGRLHYPSQNLRKSRRNGVGCLTRPGCFWPPSTEHDSLRFLRQRGPRDCAFLQAQSWQRPQPTNAPLPRPSPGARAPQKGGSALHSGNCSSAISSAHGRPSGWDSHSQKPPRGRLA